MEWTQPDERLFGCVLRHREAANIDVGLTRAE